MTVHKSEIVCKMFNVETFTEKIFLTCLPSSITLQARQSLPNSDSEIGEVTFEMVKNLSIVSEDLAMATNTTDNYGLLPLDLQSTNNIVAQVRLSFVYAEVSMLCYSDFSCPGEQYRTRS